MGFANITLIISYVLIIRKDSAVHIDEALNQAKTEGVKLGRITIIESSKLPSDKQSSRLKTLTNELGIPKFIRVIAKKFTINFEPIHLEE